MWRGGLVAALGLLAVAGVWARQSAPQQPTFRAGVDVVQLDGERLLDKDQKPVRGLAEDDFTVLEDDKPRPVVGFSEINIPDAPPPTAKWMLDASTNVESNEVDGHRVFVIVLDDANVSTVGRNFNEPVVRSKAAANAIIDRLGPNDLATVIFTRDNRGAQEFTSDHVKLRAAVEKMTFGFKGSLLFDIYAIETLKQVIDALAAIPGRRKAIFDISVGAAVDPSGSGQAPFELHQVFDYAQRANVNVNVIDPIGLSFLRDPFHDARLSFLMVTAENTGGRAVVQTNDPIPGIEQVFRDNSSYYLVGYTTADAAKYHRLSVRVDRPGVTVRTRSKSAPAVVDAEPGAVPPPATGAVSGLLPKMDLPMRIAVAPFAMGGGGASALAIVTSVRAPAGNGGVGPSLAGDLQFEVHAFTPEGTPRGTVISGTRTIRPAIGGARDAPIEILSRVDLPPGMYELRVGTHSSTLDKSGGVYATVEIPNFIKAPLSMSGLLLSLTPAPAAIDADAFSSILPLVPTASRTFTRGERVRAFVRVYTNAKTSRADLVITASVLDDHDAAVFHRETTVPAADFDAAKPHDEGIDVPLASFNPGAHLLRIDVTSGKSTASRSVEFTVK